MTKSTAKQNEDGSRSRIWQHNVLHCAECTSRKSEILARKVRPLLFVLALKSIFLLLPRRVDNRGLTLTEQIRYDIYTVKCTVAPTQVVAILYLLSSILIPSQVGGGAA